MDGEALQATVHRVASPSARAQDYSRGVEVPQ